MEAHHHAVLVKYSPVAAFDLKSLGDFSEVQDSYFERFGIEDARRLINEANNLPVVGDIQTLVIRTEFITLEAQNALLKILEEPPQTTQIIFILATGFQVLPTLLSRFSVADFADTEKKNNLPTEFSDFLAGSYAERLQLIEVSVKKKNLAWQQLIKQGLLVYLGSVKSDALLELEYVASHLLTRGASNKLLLEHLALVLPVRD